MDIRAWWATAHGLAESDTTTFAHNTAWCTFLYPFTFNILMSLYLKLVSHRQHISGSSFFIYYGNLSFLADAINFWKYSSLLLQAFLLFLLLVLASCVCYSVCSCLTFLRYSVSFFVLQSFFCFCLFWKFLFTYTQTQILPSAVSNLLIRPSKHSFLLLHCFLFLSFLKFYLRISIYPLAVHICSSISSMFLLTSLAY